MFFLIVIGFVFFGYLCLENEVNIIVVRDSSLIEINLYLKF